MQEQNSKICTKCGDSNPATKKFWNAHKLGKFGLNPVCKSCRAKEREANYERDYARQQEWKAANRERYLVALRCWRDNNRDYKLDNDRCYYWEHRDEHIERRRQYYRDHREEHYAKTEAWRLANLEKARAYSRAYVKRNPDKSLANVRFYQASKLKRTPSWLTREQRLEIAWFYKQARRQTHNTGISHHVDHIVPLKGENVSGLHVPWNLQVISAVDNIRKSNHLVSESVGFTKGSPVCRQRSFWEDA